MRARGLQESGIIDLVKFHKGAWEIKLQVQGFVFFSKRCEEFLWGIVILPATMTT